jgi:hypothetical protein
MMRRSPGPAVVRAMIALQILLLIGYAVLHSPLVNPLTRLLHVRHPDFCYFVCL